MIVYNAAMNIEVLMFFQISVLGLFRYLCKSGIAGSRMNLDNIMLSEISQSEKDKYHMISLTCGF